MLQCASCILWFDLQNGHGASATLFCRQPILRTTFQFASRNYKPFACLIFYRTYLVKNYANIHCSSTCQIIVPQKYIYLLQIQKPDSGRKLVGKKCQHCCLSAFLHRAPQQMLDQSDKTLHRPLLKWFDTGLITSVQCCMMQYLATVAQREECCSCNENVVGFHVNVLKSSYVPVCDCSWVNVAVT